MVNTFIISTHLPDTFSLLDYKRLGKQRLEAKQLINILEKMDNGEDVNNIGFAKHPACLMWFGYTNALKAYFNLCVIEWISRGYKNTMELYDVDHDKFVNVECEFDGISTVFKGEDGDNPYEFPPFASFPPFILSHKAALIRKNPVYYKDLLCEEVEPYIKLGYLWPSKVSDEIYLKWDMKYLEAIGSGAPPQYRISETDAINWNNDKTRNPKTKRIIKENSKIYKEYSEVAKFYNLT